MPFAYCQGCHRELSNWQEAALECPYCSYAYNMNGEEITEKVIEELKNLEERLGYLEVGNRNPNRRK